MCKIFAAFAGGLELRRRTLRWLLPTSSVLAFILVAALPGAQAQDLAYETNNGAITITGYTGSGGDVTIPATIGGLPVSTIGPAAFENQLFLTSITISTNVTSIGYVAFAYTGLTNLVLPDSVTNIADSAFSTCSRLLAVTLPSTVTTIGQAAFLDCESLTNITIPPSITNLPNDLFAYCTALNTITIPSNVTSIGGSAFQACDSLTSITIPASVTQIGDQAFLFCSSLTNAFFLGDCPSAGFDVFPNSTKLYYLPGSTGWAPTAWGRTTALWLPQVQLGKFNSGAGTKAFGFGITWASGRTVVVDAATNLSNPAWVPLTTNSLTTGAVDFSDPEWTNFSSRFYRVRWP